MTGANSGIGKAVAIAFAREGADVLVSYLDEDEDARETQRHVQDAGRRALLVPGDLADPSHCRAVVAEAVDEFGRVDVLVSNAAFQMTHESLEEIPDEEWDRTLAINLSAMFHLCKAAVPHMAPGSSIIGSTSVNSDMPVPTLLPTTCYISGARIAVTGGKPILWEWVAATGGSTTGRTCARRRGHGARGRRSAGGLR